MDSLVNRPNTIVQRQRAFQADPRPVYLKTPRARLYMGMYMTVFTVGLLGSLWGTSNMIRGKKN